MSSRLRFTSQFCCTPTWGIAGVWTDLGRRCLVLTRHSGTMALSLLELLPSLVQKAWLVYWLWTVWQLRRASKRSQEELVKLRWYLKSSCSEHLPGVGCPGLQTEVLRFLCVWPQHRCGVATCRMHEFLQFHTPVIFALSASSKWAVTTDQQLHSNLLCSSSWSGRAQFLCLSSIKVRTTGGKREQIVPWAFC